MLWIKKNWFFIALVVSIGTFWLFKRFLSDNSDALMILITTIYVIANRRVFVIFFLHMFKNIILTGAMIYPFSDTYSVVVVPVEIVMDVLFYLIVTRTKYYKRALENVSDYNGLK